MTSMTRLWLRIALMLLPANFAVGLWILGAPAPLRIGGAIVGAVCFVAGLLLVLTYQPEGGW